MAGAEVLELPFRLASGRRLRQADEPKLAMHEAAHGVSAFTLGWKVLSVTIEPDFHPVGGEPCLGKAMVRAPARRRHSGWGGDRRHALETMVISLSGPAGQRRLGSRGLRSAASGDYETVARIVPLVAADAEGERSLRRYACSEARDLVEYRWSEIRTVAELLQDRRTIGHAEVGEIVSRIEQQRAAAVERILEKDPGAVEKATAELRLHRRKAEGVSRRVLANAALNAVLDSLAVGEPLDETILHRYIEGEVGWRDLDLATAQAKLNRLLEHRRQRFTWKPVVPTP